MFNINLAIPWKGSISLPLMDFFHILIANIFEKKISQITVLINFKYIKFNCIFEGDEDVSLINFKAFLVTCILSDASDLS